LQLSCEAEGAAFRWLNRPETARKEPAVKKGTRKRLTQSVLAIAPAGVALLRSRGLVRRRIAGAMVLAGAGAAAVAGVRLMRRRGGTVQQGRFTSEAEIDSRIAESFPASDPPWQP
jgi:chemotaxis response regulator CheB